MAASDHDLDEAYAAGAAHMLRAVLDTVDVEVQLGLGATQYLRDQLASIRVLRAGDSGGLALANAHVRGGTAPPDMVALVGAVLDRAAARASTASQRLGLSDIQAGVLAAVVASTPLGGT